MKIQSKPDTEVRLLCYQLATYLWLLRLEEFSAVEPVAEVYGFS